MSFRIHKGQKLKSEKAIGQLFLHGKSLFIYPVKIQYQIEITDEVKDHGLQFSVSVSKKYFKRAVDRNLLKRRMREAFRLQKNALEYILVEKPISLKIMLIYVSKEIVDYNQIHKSVDILLSRLKPKIKKAKQSTDSTEADSHEDGEMI